MLSLVQEIRVRKELAVTSTVHLGYRRCIANSEVETEVVWLAPSTTVAEALNLFIEV